MFISHLNIFFFKGPKKNLGGNAALAQGVKSASKKIYSKRKCCFKCLLVLQIRHKYTNLQEKTLHELQTAQLWKVYK